MRSKWTVLAAAAATLWVAPQLAAAEDVEDQLRQMNDRMAQMEQQLQATNEELAASKQQVDEQQSVIQDLDADREASSALSRFLSETEFSGLVAASYTFNFKRLDNSAVGRNAPATTSGENAGAFGLTAPFHTNSNNFQVDQLAFRMKKQATPESRAAWGASLTWGSSADWLAGRISSCSPNEGGGGDCDTNSDATGNLPELTEAYAGYLWDVGGGIKSTLGRYMTPVGAESFFANENMNVTRGLLWTLQPVNHTGGNLSGEFGESFTWQVGGSNTYGNTQSNPDTHPTFVGSVGYKADTLGFKVNGVYGGDVDDLLAPMGQFGLIIPETDFNTGFERNSDNVALLDAVLTWDPSDKLATWVNFDYWWTGKTGYGSTADPTGIFTLDNLTIWGIAAAGRYAVTDSTGFSLRYEYLRINNLGVAGNTSTQTFLLSRGADFTLMSLTGTLDHHLTDNLVLSAEARWDRGRGTGDDDYFLNKVSGDGNTAGSLDDSDFLEKGSNHQVLGIVQLRYDF